MWAELCKRGLQARVDTGAIASSPPLEHDIHTATYKSYPHAHAEQLQSPVQREDLGDDEDRSGLKLNSWRGATAEERNG